MSWLRFVAPAASILVLTLAATLPWGMPLVDRFMLPLLPIIAIYHWTLDRDAWLPEWFIFLAGLTLDVLTQGPLGYWALVYLFAFVTAIFASRFNAGSTLRRMALLAGAIATVSVFAWLVASFYYLDMLDPRPYARGTIFAVMTAFLIIPILGFLRAISTPIRAARLTRGG